MGFAEGCCVHSMVAGVKAPCTVGEGKEDQKQGLRPPNRYSPLLTGLLVPDSQAAGQQELCRQEPGSRGDTGLHVSDLLGQDRDPHSEPHDRVPSLV